MTLSLSKRDAATLVAALHAWQNELSYHRGEELAQWHPELRDHQPLTIAEVQKLLGPDDRGLGVLVIDCSWRRVDALLGSTG